MNSYDVGSARGTQRSIHVIQNHTSRTGRETHIGGRTRLWGRPDAFLGYKCIQQPTWTRRFRKMLPTLGCAIGYNSQFPGAAMCLELALQFILDAWGGSQMIFPDFCHKRWHSWWLTHLHLELNSGLPPTIYRGGLPLHHIHYTVRSAKRNSHKPISNGSDLQKCKNPQFVVIVRAFAKAAPGSHQNTGTASAPAQAKPAIQTGTIRAPKQKPARRAEIMKEPRNKRKFDPILGLPFDRDEQMC